MEVDRLGDAAFAQGRIDGFGAIHRVGMPLHPAHLPVMDTGPGPLPAAITPGEDRIFHLARGIGIDGSLNFAGIFAKAPWPSRCMTPNRNRCGRPSNGHPILPGTLWLSRQDRGMGRA